MLMLMPMLMMLALTLMLLLDASNVVAYAVANDANADAKIPNVARHLGGAYVVLMLPPLLPILMLLRQLLLAETCMHMCSFVSIYCPSVCDVCVHALVRARICFAGASAL